MVGDLIGVRYIHGAPGHSLRGEALLNVHVVEGWEHLDHSLGRTYVSFEALRQFVVIRY